MADLPTIFRSLEQVSTGYTVFEPNQVLSDKQLNGLVSYLDDQDRLTRVELLGVGIVGGLRVRLADNKVRVGRGVGVSTDGDLLLLTEDTVFDRYRDYDESAPLYPPFQGQDGKTIELFELLPEGGGKVAGEAPLAAFPGKLYEMVVVMFMESYLKDRDLCSSTECDNLGVDAINTIRFLLVSPTDASALLVRLRTLGRAVLDLPVLLADRPQITSAIGSPFALFQRYRGACASIHAKLVQALPLLPKILWDFMGDLFTADPVPDWIGKLNAHKKFFAEHDLGLQYYYDFLKDLVETWNALRDTLAGDDSVLCPDMLAFPKHLLLGSLSNPRASRTDLYPSPLTCHHAAAFEHARFLAWKLHVLINTFAAPGAAQIIVTPSRLETEPLEARAIPFYYQVLDQLPIHAGWNYLLSTRGEEGRNLGYRAFAYSDTDEALHPLDFQVGRFDFFRIEGHQGQKVGAAATQIQAELTRRNLPIAVRAVLVDTERKWIVVKPPIRYTDLHRFHQVIRRHVMAQVDDVADFNAKFKSGIEDAAKQAESLIPKVIGGVATAVVAKARKQDVDDVIQAVKAPLEATGYTDYRVRLPESCDADYRSLMAAAGRFMETFGDMTRIDYATPFDSLVTNYHRAWLDWLDTIIDRKNDDEDEKLLFGKFTQLNPGLEHFAGAPPGGTFVLVYDKEGVVVADFTLPYFAPETAEAEPKEPELTIPPFKPPFKIPDGFRFVPPFDISVTKYLDDFRKKIEPEWEKAVSCQKEYFTFFKDSVGAFTDLLPRGPSIDLGGINLGLGGFGGGAGGGDGGGGGGGFGDGLFGWLVNRVRDGTQRVEDLRKVVLDPATPERIRAKANKLLSTAEAELGKSITAAASHMADTKAKMAADADGGKALAILRRGVTSVTDSDARKTMEEGLKNAQPKPTEQPEVHDAVDNLLRIGGFK